MKNLHTARITAPLEKLLALLELVKDLVRDDPAYQITLGASTEPLPTNQVRRDRRYANGTRNKGISGIALCVQSVKEHPGITIEQLAPIFVKHTFAASTAAPTVGRVVQKGLIRRDEHGRLFPVKGEKK